MRRMDDVMLIITLIAAILFSVVYFNIMML